MVMLPIYHDHKRMVIMIFLWCRWLKKYFQTQTRQRKIGLCCGKDNVEYLDSTEKIVDASPMMNR
jgi:hypothetical protein